mmetsp:Transcript_71893/g.188408  ORF Transcript_71893/g.188408 Transcript_71893/m.188408 type:complete len:368 (+) Transcript_71893:23-1126(+)
MERRAIEILDPHVVHGGVEYPAGARPLPDRGLGSCDAVLPDRGQQVRLQSAVPMGADHAQALARGQLEARLVDPRRPQPLLGVVVLLDLDHLLQQLVLAQSLDPKEDDPGIEGPVEVEVLHEGLPVAQILAFRDLHHLAVGVRAVGRHHRLVPPGLKEREHGVTAHDTRVRVEPESLLDAELEEHVVEDEANVVRVGEDEVVPLPLLLPGQLACRHLPRKLVQGVHENTLPILAGQRHEVQMVLLQPSLRTLDQAAVGHVARHGPELRARQGAASPSSARAVQAAVVDQQKHVGERGLRLAFSSSSLRGFYDGSERVEGALLRVCPDIQRPDDGVYGPVLAARASIGCRLRQRLLLRRHLLLSQDLP